MQFTDFLQIALILGALWFLTPLLGGYMARVYQGQKTFFTPFISPVERLCYRLGGIDPGQEMSWGQYAVALLLFNLLGFAAVFGLQLFQAHLPLNPQGLPNVSLHLAFNTAISFMTNTNWQGYAGETTMSYLTQMLGLAVQNFLSAGTGMAVLLALTRGLVRKTAATIGNFWVDLVRSVLYILLPLAILVAIILVSQGVVQTFSPYQEATTLQGASQTIPLGPAASQIAIKQLGTNGGGFFNVNSAHPFENPTPLSNWLEMLAILSIPASLTYTFGSMVGARKQGWIIFAAMFVLLALGLGISFYSEYSGNHSLGVSSLMEGKEVRFGVTNSVIWSTFTTAASNGSVNCMHSSLTPLAGGVALLNIMLGEVIFGGVGVGLVGMLLFVLLTVFLAGLMVGRTPEYLGKKIESREMKLVMLAILAPIGLILTGSALACVLPVGLASLANRGPHGLSEILYAFSSAAGNNGSAFAGLNANTVFYNLALGFTMLVGRFAIIVPVLAMAGRLAIKKVAPVSAGTFRTDNVLFLILLIAVVLIVGVLTFFPPLALGPLVEHFLMQQGVVF